jgi:hypothetical protein
VGKKYNDAKLIEAGKKLELLAQDKIDATRRAQMKRRLLTS